MVIIEARRTGIYDRKIAQINLQNSVDIGEIIFYMVTHLIVTMYLREQK